MSNKTKGFYYKKKYYFYNNIYNKDELIELLTNMGIFSS